MKKRIWVVSGAFAAVILLIVLVSTGFVAHYILQKAEQGTGRTIESASDLKIKWGWPVTALDVYGLRLGNMSNGTQPDMMSVEHLHVSIDFLKTLRGDLTLPELILEKPDILLEKDKDGNANWHFGNNVAAGVALEAVSPDDRSDFPVIGNFAVHDGKLRYLDPVKNIDVTMSVETVTGQSPANSALHFSGKGKYQNGILAMDVLGGNILQLKNTGDPYPLKMTLQAGDTKAVIEGKVLDPFALKGLDIQLQLSGKNAAELFTLIGMALPPTPSYDVKGQLQYTQDKWQFTDFAGRMGNSDLRGSVTWDTERARPLLSGEFISNKLNFDDLGGFIGATPDESKTRADIKREQNSPYIIPETPLDISRLSAMDADVTFTGKKLISSSLPLDDFFMKVNLDNSLLKLDPVKFGTAQGDITAYMSVNARQEPVVIKGDFNFQRLKLKPIFEKFAQSFNMKNVTDGVLGGTAKLEGTGKSLRQMLSNANGTVGMGMEGGQISNLVVELLGLDVAQSLGFLMSGDKPTPIRCMIGDFNVKNGIMQVNRFVFDTKDSNIRGKGHINFRNEALDMTLQTEPKDATLVSLNSPIKVTGTLKEPKVNINPAKIAAKGAAAAAVATVVFPIVGLVAFVEPGLGKDSNCMALIHDLETKAKKQGKANIIPHNDKK